LFLNKKDATEYFDMYIGEMQDWETQLGILLSGPVLCLEVRGQDAVQNFKQTGAEINKKFFDPWGGSPLMFTEFEGEGVLECEYFFRLI